MNETFHGVFPALLTPFGAAGEGFVRISYAASLENISKAMERMESFLKRHRD